MSRMKLHNLYKEYKNGVVAVKDFNLEINNDEFVVLVGPSGCGKSTTLRMIAGLEEITKGDIYIQDVKINDYKAKDRDLSMVFQNYALYPHMNVYNNMAFGLKLRKFSKKEINKRVQEVAEVLDLKDLLKRKPRELSGGQRQRVALGRAIVREPKVFLMDEPLSNLDAKLRVQMRTEISKLHKKLGTIFIYVTHDQVEAMTMADKIVVMKDGFIQQIGTPQSVYNTPANIFAGGFIGSPSMNFIEGKIKDSKFIFGNQQLEIPNNYLKRLENYSCKEVILGIRPEDVIIAVNNEKEDLSKNIVAFIESAEFLGSQYQIHSKINDTSFIALDNTIKHISSGENMRFKFDLDKTHFFDIDTQERI